ncbi:hypothetical protein HSB1_26680 [Halogranum salarium B-1]|uniref:Uncharacterized protein n=1 Tax=Halogranum salarium B-1 TaxID=1210908 RepID=J3EWJ4_9EURY|nr:hypothetical protein HSB1_26680 [Halogranum salarium B-1]
MARGLFLVPRVVANNECLREMVDTGSLSGCDEELLDASV